ncbi:MAG TPA: zinc-ribbon domain-containing protein [Myxococcota bacterium]|nr:zinc-ribbon domain-containing protein [Myxococcota bacterium]
MIVQCENCETRFHVADARIPEKGARVRCSRCHHRFHITPSSGTTSSPNSGPDVSASTESSGREAPEPGPETSEASAGSGGGGGGDDLENPEFLFEGNAVTGAPRKAAAPPAAGDSKPSEPPASPSEPDPGSSQVRHAPDLEPAQAPEERVVATGGQTAQQMLDAGAPKLGTRTGPVEFAPSLDDADDDTRSRFALGDEAPAAEREPPPSLRPAKDKPAKPVATLTKIERPPIPAPKPPAPAAAEKSALDAAFGGSLGEEDDADTGWDSLTQSEGSGEERSVFDVGASFGLGGPSKSAPEKAAAASEEGAKSKKRRAPEMAAFDPEAGSSLARIARAAAVLVGIALVAGTLRGLYLQRSTSAAGNESVQAAGWIAADVETFVARDSLGQRVLVVRGNLFPNGAAPAPEVEVSLLGSAGEPVGEPRRAWLERLDDAEIAPDALTVKLASNDAELSGVGPQVTGFTALLADPPAAARRIDVTLVAGKLPARGTATAVAPAPAPTAPPAGKTELATPTAPAPVPAPPAPDANAPSAPGASDGVPAAPEPE